MALQGYLAEVKALSSSVVFTDEATSTTDDKVYQIVDSNKGVWTLDTITVEVDAVPTTENYTVQRLAQGGGTITFENVDALRGAVTVSGKYAVLTTVASANSYTFNGSANLQDSTPFNSAGVREFTPTTITATADLGKFYTDDFFLDSLLNDEIKVIEFYPSSVLNAIRFFALPSSVNRSSTVDSLIDESISYQVTNEYVL